MAKKGPKLKVLIWFSTTESQESPWFTCLWGACHLSLERFQRWLQLCFRFFLIYGPHKLWASKVVEVPISRILGLPNSESRKKHHLGVAPVMNHKLYYKGKGGDFPQVWAVVNLVSSCMFVVHLCTKSVPTIHWPTCCLVYVDQCE
jgi:hypothetical protein